MALSIISTDLFLDESRDNPVVAVAAILVAVFALSLGDALIKQQSVSFVLWQIFVMRSVIAIPLLIFFARLDSCSNSLLPASIRWTVARSLLLVTMWVFYFAALPRA